LKRRIDFRLHYVTMLAAVLLMIGDGESEDWDIGWLVFTSTLSITLWSALGGFEPRC
jgi:hypothetical protein